MRKFALFASAMALAAIAAPHAYAQTTEEDCAGSLSIAAEDKRQFAEQDLTVHEGLTGVGNLNISCPFTDRLSVYVNGWRGQTNVEEHNETDYGAGIVYRADDETRLDLSYSQFRIQGPEAYRFRALAHRDLNEQWAVEANYDVVRGGFKTDVARLQVFRTDHLVGSFSNTIRVGISHDTWSGDVVAQWQVGVSTPFLLDTTLSAYVQGYQGLTGGNDGQTGSDTMAGIGLSHAFSLPNIFSRF